MLVQWIRNMNRQRLTWRHRRRSGIAVPAAPPGPAHQPRPWHEAARAFMAAHPDLRLGPQRGDTLRFSHSGNAGDLIYSLPAIFEMAAGTPCSLYLQADVAADAIPGHPVGNVRLNDLMIERLLPLLHIQPGIAHVAKHRGEPIDVPIDLFRDAPILTDRGNIIRWYCAVFAISLDLSKPWLHAEPMPGLEDTVLIARSSRYRNLALDYRFLDRLPRIAFVGLPAEFEDMRTLLPSLQYLPTDDFLQLARAIRGCRLFIGNQSSPFSVAEALKVPRIVECNHIVPNVIPEGHGGYEAWFQPQFEFLVRHCLER